MKLTRKKAEILTSAIHECIDVGIVAREQGEKLLTSFEVIKFDWKRLAKYSFWISIICAVISAIALIADEALRKLLERIFDSPPIVKCLGSAVIAALTFFYGIRRKGKNPKKTFSNEAILFLGVLATAGSIAFLGQSLDTGSKHYSVLFLLAAIIYGALGLWFDSKLIWIFSLISLGSWLGAETGYMSGWGAYYLGMNYPLRFVLFGCVLTAASTLFRSWSNRNEFLKPTRAMGLLYLFISLWIMSIFGNYGDINKWQAIKQVELLHWSLLFGIIAGASIYHGIKMDDGMTRGFGITFLFINLYTRFFEYFWDGMHKAIFFGLLAISFWALGSHAENIWNLGIDDENRSR